MLLPLSLQLSYSEPAIPVTYTFTIIFSLPIEAYNSLQLVPLWIDNKICGFETLNQ